AVTLDGDGAARAADPDGRCLHVRAFSTVALKAELAEGELTPPRGWMSPDYGRREPAPLLVYTAVTRLPLRIVTLLAPSADDVRRAVTPLYARDGQATGVDLDGLEIRLAEGALHVGRAEWRW